VQGKEGGREHEREREGGRDRWEDRVQESTDDVQGRDSPGREEGREGPLCMRVHTSKWERRRRASKQEGTGAHQDNEGAKQSLHSMSVEPGNQDSRVEAMDLEPGLDCAALCKASATLACDLSHPAPKHGHLEVHVDVEISQLGLGNQPCSPANSMPVSQLPTQQDTQAQGQLMAARKRAESTTEDFNSWKL
jgi:hypothetical protein